MPVFQTDQSKVSNDLCITYAEAADDFHRNGGQSRAWSSSERIAAALILGNPDILQGVYRDPIDAIERLNNGSESSFHTVLHLRDVGYGKYLPS